MSAHIIVVTHIEEPKVYLAQTEFAELIATLRLDGQFAYKRSNIYALVPDPNPDHQPSRLNALRLMKVGSTDDRHPADSHFQEAMNYLEGVGDKYQLDFISKWRDVLDKVEVKLREEMKPIPTGS